MSVARIEFGSRFSISPFKEAAEGQPQITSIKMEDIFSKSSGSLSHFGSIIDGTLRAMRGISDPGLSDGRREEIKSELEERCRRFNISKAHLPEIQKQYNDFLQQRGFEDLGSSSVVITPSCNQRLEKTFNI